MTIGMTLHPLNLLNQSVVVTLSSYLLDWVMKVKLLLLCCFNDIIVFGTAYE
jgi:hypothetical protein